MAKDEAGEPDHLRVQRDAARVAEGSSLEGMLAALSAQVTASAQAKQSATQPLPCPHCAATKFVIEVVEPAGAAALLCTACGGAMMIKNATADQLVQAWNRRV